MQLTGGWQYDGMGLKLSSIHSINGDFLTQSAISQSSIYLIILAKLGGHCSRSNPFFKIVGVLGISR